MEIATYSLIIIYVISHTFLYRFQRVTLGISRKMGDRKIQAILTPMWITLVYWFNFILLIGISILVFKIFSWVWLIIFLIYSFVITPIIDNLFPVPPHKICFEIIKKGLRKDIENSKDDRQKETFSKLLEMVESEEGGPRI